MGNTEKAVALENTVATKNEILEMINLFKEGIEENKHDLLATWKVGQYSILIGAAHSNNKPEKEKYYNQSMDYCERAMRMDQNFNDALNSGKTIWDAVKLLGFDYVNAMGFWYTARVYHFKECLSVMGRIFNGKSMSYNELIMNRIDELNPNWEGGGNNLSKAIFYIATPEKFGGSKQKAAEEFEKAIELGPNYLTHKWGRAKYLSVITGEKDLFVEDLKWIIEQDPKKCGNPYPWNLYFQRTAREMLAETEKIFG
jgi:tetratricopeptide (TPR) repeat protein